LSGVVLSANKGARQCLQTVHIPFGFNEYYTNTFEIPLCGTAATACSSYNSFAIDQIDDGVSHYNQGTYNPGSWIASFEKDVKIQDGTSPAVSSQNFIQVTYDHGDSCGFIDRITTVKIFCDATLPQVFITGSQPTTCVYEVIIKTPDEEFCSSISKAAELAMTRKLVE
jgi:hypothetical protein